MKRKAKHKWIQYSQRIKLNDNSNLLDCIFQRSNCSQHELDYILTTSCFNEGRYRRYRRGKNRCKFCGFKV